MKTFPLFAPLCILGLALATPAFAAPADSAPMAEARQRFNEGITFADNGDHEAARLKFSQAYALLKSAKVLFNLARAEQLSGHLLEALDHYRQFGKSSDPSITDVQRQRASENIAELSKKVGQIDIEAPPTARLSLDGHSLDSAPQDPIPVMTGKHVVEAVVDGKVRSVTVEAQAGTVTKARLLDPPKDEPKPPVVAPAAATSTEPPPVAPTSHFWTTGRVVGGVVAILGVGALGTGAVFHFVAGGHDDDAVTKRAALPSASACAGASSPACSDLQSDIDARNSAETLRNAFLIGGAALAVGGIVLFVVSKPHQTEVGVSPTGLVMRGAF